MRNGSNRYEVLQCICCSCVVFKGIWREQEDGSHLRKGSVCSIRQLGTETQLTAPPTWVSCGPWTSPSLHPAHQREAKNPQLLLSGSWRIAAVPVPPVSCQGIFLAALMPFSGSEGQPKYKLEREEAGANPDPHRLVQLKTMGGKGQSCSRQLVKPRGPLLSAQFCSVLLRGIWRNWFPVQGLCFWASLKL